MADPMIAARVDAAVAAWLEWLPRWTPGSFRSRARICRRCYQSPILASAGLSHDVPHQVQHALVVRLQKIIDKTVDEFTTASLPGLRLELDAADALKQKAGYRPNDGLDPEYDGLELDPEPEPGQPFLFTLEGLASPLDKQINDPRPPLTDDQKAELRSEMALADECAVVTGQRVCGAVKIHAPRIRLAVETFVEPQIQSMLDELTNSLEFPS
ncbi:spermidine/putrescine ABC transporter substrate-binding protein [Lysinibacter cavernae]|uniref:Spermidine/putrescine ABC transporter substrate-binding protein n=1 Tax=Lysinibacter cavernae TaxID=1640652 RepID=A0A7X5R218_9MICO|nr:spermidine/putrescine ABC transporter substrate-binding protein [Lysinibacter cavernae]NIH54223.1 hypothetical protein [Lysinibacter cavernae]